VSKLNLGTLRSGSVTYRARQALEFYLYVGPWILGFVLLTAGPMIYSLVLSFHEFDLFHPWRYVGLENYRFLLFEPFPKSLFWKSLGVTAYYSALSVPVGVIASLILAVLLNTKIRGVPLYRTLFYLPSLTPSVASALLWIWIFNSRFGLANAVLRLFGIPPIHWLTDANVVIPAFVLMGLWSAGGNTMVIFLAGLQGVPQHLYEAAQIDGAGWYQKLRTVTLPMISPTIFFNLILGVIGSFQVFGTSFLMTSGGPDYATYFLVYYIYAQAFQMLHMGLGSAIAWALFLIQLTLTLLQFYLSKKWVYYAGEA